MNTLVQFRADEATKLQATIICEKLGIDLATYLRICISRLVQENGIPFVMKLSQTEKTGIEAMKEANYIAEKIGISDMTLDEINAEIREARNMAK